MNKLLLYLLILFPFFYLTSSILHLTSFLYSYPSGWSDDILLTPDDPNVRMDPDVDIDEYNNVWVTWDSTSWTNGEILFSKRDSLGNCIIPESTVSNNVSKSWMSRIVIDNSNNAQFIWRDESPQGDGVWHAKLANDGSVIVTSHLAVSGAGGGSSSLRPEMVLNKYNEINIIWDESPSGYNQMNYTKLDSLGNPVIEKIRVSLENVGVYWPGIGIDSIANSHLGYAVTTTESLIYTKLDKNGNVLIDNKFLGTGLLPTIIADRSQNIHMVYPHPTGSGWSIEYLKLSNNGSILISPKTISIHEHNMSPHMAMDSLQYLHVVWHLEDPQGIMYTKLDTLGNFVISPIMVVYPPEAVWPAHPRIAVDYSNRLHLVWKDQRFNPGVSTDIFYKRGENENTIEETAQLKTANLQNISVFPNPFSKLIKISFGNVHPDRITRSSYGTGSAEGIELKIFDATGRLVRSFPIINLCNSNKSVVSVCWDGTDDFGNSLPAGVYFIHISHQQEFKSVPVVLLKN